MREHEVPTHVQAEDRVLLGFTFPQVVAITAVCALSYGAYRYAPVGPSEVRMALAVLLGLAGLVAVVGKIGGRRLPLVAADLLKYRLGARLYAGPPSELVRSEPPAPAQPVESGPGPLRLMARRAGRTLRSLRRRRKGRERQGGRMPFRPHRWLGKRSRGDAEKDNINGNGNGAGSRKDRRRNAPKTPDQVRGRLWQAVVAVAALAAAVATVPQTALADDHWRDEIDFEIEKPVEGRRLFVEGLTVTGDRAAVTLRAATDLDLQARAYGGGQGRELRSWGAASLDEGERIDYSLPLHGPAPSFTFSWEDTLGQAGAVTFGDGQVPYPLPAIDGELCDLRVVSLGWVLGAVEGAVASECVAEIKEALSLQTVAGHHTVTETALMDAEVTAITGTVAVSVGGAGTSASFVPGGETRFSIPVAVGEAVHGVAIDVDLEAALRIALPPLVQLTHHPKRTEYRTETVSLLCPGISETVSETVTVTHEGGTTTQHTISATLSIPSEVVYEQVTLATVHPERIEAAVVERSPISRSRDEALALASSVGADDPFEALVLPEPEPAPPSTEQMPVGGDLSDWFHILGWEWPW